MGLFFILNHQLRKEACACRGADIGHQPSAFNAVLVVGSALVPALYMGYIVCVPYPSGRVPGIIEFRPILRPADTLSQLGGRQCGKIIECVHTQERTAPGPFIIHARRLSQTLPGLKHLLVRACFPCKCLPIRFIEIENLRGFCHRNHPVNAVSFPDSLLQEFGPVSVQFFLGKIVIQMNQRHDPVQPVRAVRVG